MAFKQAVLTALATLLLLTLTLTTTAAPTPVSVQAKLNTTPSPAAVHAAAEPSVEGAVVDDDAAALDVLSSRGGDDEDDDSKCVWVRGATCYGGKHDKHCKNGHAMVCVSYDSVAAVRAAAEPSVEGAVVDDDAAALDVLSRGDDDEDGHSKCIRVWVVKCYDEKRHTQCKKIRAVVCGGVRH